MLRNSPDTRALHLRIGGTKGLKQVNAVFSKLQDMFGDKVQNKKLTAKELSERGYDPTLVKQVVCSSFNIIILVCVGPGVPK